jgi:hypothetical protein
VGGARGALASAALCAVRWRATGCKRRQAIGRAKSGRTGQGMGFRHQTHRVRHRSLWLTTRLHRCGQNRGRVIKVRALPAALLRTGGCSSSPALGPTAHEEVVEHAAQLIVCCAAHQSCHALRCDRAAAHVTPWCMATQKNRVVKLLGHHVQLMRHQLMRHRRLAAALPCLSHHVRTAHWSPRLSPHRRTCRQRR